jgi:periplasmic divalent cation tolerance protein
VSEDSVETTQVAPCAVAILTTTSKGDEATQIATTLVEEGLAACVNIVPGVRSIYRWEGKVHDDVEQLLVVKTTPAGQGAVVERIQQLHSYDCPEAIALPVIGGSRAYLDWVGKSVSGS